MHKSKPLIPEPSSFEDKIATENLKRHKLPGNYQVAAELVQTGGNTLSSEIHKLINSLWNKEEL